jgi:hypothetical protein
MVAASATAILIDINLSASFHPLGRQISRQTPAKAGLPTHF